MYTRESFIVPTPAFLHFLYFFVQNFNHSCPPPQWGILEGHGGG